MKRYSPKKIIEIGNPKTEQAYIKFPREKLIKVSNKVNEKENSVKVDMKLIKYMLNKNKIHNKYTQIHTHPYLGSKMPNALPSGQDLESFYYINKQKAEVIAQKNVQTGEVLGYTILLKKENKGIEYPDLFGVKYSGLFGPFKEIYFREKLGIQSKKYNKKLSTKKINPREGYDELKKICEKQNWKLRFVPAKEYYFNKETGNFEKKQGIEKIVASIFGVSVLTFLFFNISKLTGFAINENKNLQLIGTNISSVLILLTISWIAIRKFKTKINKNKK